MKKHFDKKAKVRRLEVNDKVLVMLPTDSLKLLMQWKGPFVVEEVIRNCDYRVKLATGSKVFHINMLKKFHERGVQSS